MIKRLTHAKNKYKLRNFFNLENLFVFFTGGAGITEKYFALNVLNLDFSCFYLLVKVIFH